MRSPDRICETHARRQGGFVTKAQCIEAGLTPRAIQQRVRAFGWERWLPHVYLLPGVVPDSRGRLKAALLWGGDEAILSHASAAYVHQLEGSAASDIPTLYVPTGKTTAKVEAHRLPPAPLPKTSVRGLRVTRVEGTLSDLASRWAPARVGRAMDDALRRGLTNLDRLAAEASRAKAERRPGAAVFRRLVTGRDHRDAKARSRFETLTLNLLNELEPPCANHRVGLGKRNLYLDFAYPSLLLAVECQSIRWHLGEEAFRSDMARHRQLTALGWVVLFVCWDDVVFDRESLKQEIAAALEARRTFMRPELLPG